MWMDLSIIMESEETWVSSDYSVLTLWLSGIVGMVQPPVGAPSRDFLGGEGTRLKGQANEPESPWAPEARGGICSFVSHPVRDIVRGLGDSDVPVGRHRGAPKPWALGALGSSPILSLDWRWSWGSGSGYCLSRAWSLCEPLSPKQRLMACLGFAWSLARRCVRAYLMDIAPERSWGDRSRGPSIGNLFRDLTYPYVWVSSHSSLFHTKH
jgi:hypothetical protein